MAEEALISDSSPLPRYFDTAHMNWMLEEHLGGHRNLNRRIRNHGWHLQLPG